MTRRWVHRPDHSTWGDWGDDDQLGRLNLIGPDQVLAAVSEVEVGKVFPLSLPLDRPDHPDTNPSRHPPVIRALHRNGELYFNYVWEKTDERLTDVASDDSVTLAPQYSTHWDALAHRGALWRDAEDQILRPTYYNGFRADEHMHLLADGETQVGALAVEKLAEHGLQGRGVMINLEKYRSDFSTEQIGFSELQHVLVSEAIAVNPGDMVCFWTGFDEVLMGLGDCQTRGSYFRLNGFDSELREWVIDSQVSALISDNPAIEFTGTDLPEGYRGSALPLHELCLFKLGMPLGELWFLSELARWLDANGRHHFLLTAPPLRLTGAVASPLTPLATV